MVYDTVMYCFEISVCCKGALMRFAVTDSPSPDKVDKDEFGMMGYEAVVSDSEAVVGA